MTTNCDISIDDVKNHQGESIDASKFTKVQTISWPLEGWQTMSRNVNFREKLANIEEQEDFKNK